MEENLKKLYELANQINDLADTFILLAQVPVEKLSNNKVDAHQALVSGKGSSFQMATLVTEFLKQQPTVKSNMKLIELLPNAYSTEEITNDQTIN